MSAAYVPTVCYCKGAYVCDMHRQKPKPPPAGACVLCGHVKPGEPMVEGRDGIRWHDECAKDNS